MADRFDLDRFVTAQEGIYAQALAELSVGRKESHWMWFIFPQLASLGRSAMAQHYGIGSRAEAAAYLAHPVLGNRLVACTKAALDHAGASAETIFGGVDALTFRSSMTLFDRVGGDKEPSFSEAIAAFCDGEPDQATLAMLGER